MWPVQLPARARSGDVVITMGAGDVTTIGPAVLDLLAARAGPAPQRPSPGDDFPPRVTTNIPSPVGQTRHSGGER
jgi:hypothetical protein